MAVHDNVEKIRKTKGIGIFTQQVRESLGWARIQASMKVNDLCKKCETIVREYAIEKRETGKVLSRLESTIELARAYRRPEIVQRRINTVVFCKKEKNNCTAILN
ncbi:hypothetical protein [Anaerosinus massiliensis]|uniref:hypothetical protein n=1 Tax=Massilibacillus massiliensis TaxID=1806837 RepID=UPI000DA61008|nr:hypothetical protein [Massilibacillus massiliensis]